MLNKNNKPMVIFLLGILWIVSMFFDQTRSFGWIFLGLCIFILGLWKLYIRIDYDVAAKAKVLGELVELENIADEDVPIYRPHYKYVYNDEERIHKSNLSSAKYIETKQIGESVELLILIKNPSRIRMSNRAHQLIEYIALVLFIGVGVFMMIAGMLMLL